MPPKKRTHSRHTNTRRPSKRMRASDLTEVPPEAAVASQHHRASQNLISVDLQALSASIAATVSQAVQDALGAGGTRNSTQDPEPSTSFIPDISECEVPPRDPVEEEIAAISGPGTNRTSSPRQPFSSSAIALGARVGPKLKAKIWANEYVDFGCLLSPTPSTERYSLSLTPSGTFSAQPQLTLEPAHAPKKIYSLYQWLTAFNTFVAIYVEKYPSDAPLLMKYCEVVRDIASKPGDWLFYDEQFRYIRQSAPASYPWDTIHWKLWLRAVSNFRARPAMPSDKVSPRSRSRQTFPRGTCWAFQGGRFCGGCRFAHVCFKCGAPHPASQCAQSASPRPTPVQPGNKQSPPAHPPAHQSGNPRKAGQA